jgi:hypothetical protein
MYCLQFMALAQSLLTVRQILQHHHQCCNPNELQDFMTISLGLYKDIRALCIHPRVYVLTPLRGLTINASRHSLQLAIHVPPAPRRIPVDAYWDMYDSSSHTFNVPGCRKTAWRSLVRFALSFTQPKQTHVAHAHALTTDHNNTLLLSLPAHCISGPPWRASAHK